jgi:hypothetical protein
VVNQKRTRNGLLTDVVHGPLRPSQYSFVHPCLRTQYSCESGPSGSPEEVVPEDLPVRGCSPGSSSKPTTAAVSLLSMKCLACNSRMLLCDIRYSAYLTEEDFKIRS